MQRPVRAKVINEKRKNLQKSKFNVYRVSQNCSGEKSVFSSSLYLNIDIYYTIPMSSTVIGLDEKKTSSYFYFISNYIKWRTIRDLKKDAVIFPCKELQTASF